MQVKMADVFHNGNTISIGCSNRFIVQRRKW